MGRKFIINCYCEVTACTIQRQRNQQSLNTKLNKDRFFSVAGKVGKTLGQVAFEGTKLTVKGVERVTRPPQCWRCGAIFGTGQARNDHLQHCRVNPNAYQNRLAQQEQPGQLNAFEDHVQNVMSNPEPRRALPNVQNIIVDVFRCPICGRDFSTREEAVKCKQSHFSASINIV